MASESDLELRVSRLENDSTALYELIADVTATLTEHARRLTQLEQRLDRVEQRLDGMDARLDRVEHRLDAIEQRLDGIEGLLAEVLRRLPEPA